jgi:Holliday junction resolvase
MLESKIQSNIIKDLEKKGWYVLKVIKCNKNGFPDLVAFNGKETIFIEVKGLKGKQSPLQKYREKELTELGYRYFLTTEKINL